MRKLLVTLALGVGLWALGGETTAAALPKQTQRTSRGVRMKCHARLGTCKFKSQRPVGMKCRYKVRFLVKPRRRGKPRRLTRTGRVTLAPRGVRIKAFYRGRRSVLEGFLDASLFCHKR